MRDGADPWEIFILPTTKRKVFAKFYCWFRLFCAILLCVSCVNAFFTVK